MARLAITDNTKGASPVPSAIFRAVFKFAAAAEKSPASPLHDAFRHHARAWRPGSS